MHNNATTSADRLDYEIMRAHTLAILRGATPAEILRNIMSLDSDEFPIRMQRGPWKAR